MNVSFYSWGGDPIRRLGRGAGIQDSDVETFRRWSQLISDPANVKDDWLPWAGDGRVWLEGPSSDFKRRLLLRPFQQASDGSRSIWYFWGFSFPLDAPKTWAKVFRKLIEFDRGRLEECGGEIELSDAYDDMEVPVTRNPVGRVFEGSYDDALRELCAGIAASSHEQLRNLSIACHPSRSLAGFSTLVRADDFPLKGVGILLQEPGNTVISDPAAEPRTTQDVHLPSTQNSEAPFKTGITLVVAFSIGFALGRITDENDKQARRLKQEVEKLEVENRFLRVQIEQRSATR